jgi:Na+-translocating ferredoxin:NAD+ oxidoreductase RnfE subunit
VLQHLVFLGAIVQLVGALSYIRGTLRGVTKPNRVTWLLWGVIPIIATAASWSDGVRWAALPVFMAGFCPLLVFAFSFVNRNAFWKLERLDYLCGFFSVGAIILWVLTRTPAVAIILSIVADALAAIPTLVKSWHHPETENTGPYWAGMVSQLTAIAAFRLFTVSEIAFPVYLLIINTMLVLVIKRKALFKSPPG